MLNNQSMCFVRCSNASSTNTINGNMTIHFLLFSVQTWAKAFRHDEIWQSLAGNNRLSIQVFQTRVCTVSRSWNDPKQVSDTYCEMTCHNTGNLPPHMLFDLDFLCPMFQPSQWQCYSICSYKVVRLLFQTINTFHYDGLKVFLFFRWPCSSVSCWGWKQQK